MSDSDIEDDLGYKSTPALPDAEGEALLEKLDTLCWAIAYDENNKKVRHGSHDELSDGRRRP